MPGTMRCDLSMETLTDWMLTSAPSMLVTHAAHATTAVSVEAGAIKDTAAACFFIVPVQVDLTTHVVRDASSSGL